MWDWDYVISIAPKFMPALQTALLATLWGFLVACSFGLLLAILGRMRFKPVRFTATAFVEFVRSTPLLVQLFFLFYVLPVWLGFYPSPFVIGVIGLGLHYSTYMSEVFRSGIDGVDKGQWEAAKALNFSKVRTWSSVILPQAFPPVLPIMGNYLIIMFKETPLLAAISVVELLTVAKNISSQSWRALEPFTLIGLLFLAVSLLFTYLVGRIERKLNQRDIRQ